MSTQKEKFMKRFNSGGQILREQHTYLLYTLKFYHNKFDVETFCIWPYSSRQNDKVSDEQVLEHFKEAFPPKIRLNYMKAMALTQW